jgi:hypothetical protein
VSVSARRHFAAFVAAIGFGALFVFQIVLATGLPLGRAAFGGASDTLSPELRITSVVSAFLLLWAIWTVLACSDVIAAGKRARAIARWLIWGFVVLFSLSAVANIASSSPWERFGMAPFAVVLVVCCVIVGLGSRVR